ncbi:MAG: hypothetical protein FJ280_12325 [Planctomycetes bacterium]|nr:hypothetical protein [Planctomycetota bacterium]
MSARLAMAMPYRICVYPSPDDPDLFIAHCLELDLIGVGGCVATALTELLENIDTQRDICRRTDAQFFHPAPPVIWQRYKAALKANRKICDELMERVIAQANRRLGHNAPTIDRVLATKKVPRQYLAV